MQKTTDWKTTYRRSVLFEAMRRLLIILDKWSVSLILLSLVLVRFPSFSFIPGLAFFRSQVLVKGLILMVLAVFYVQPRIRNIWTSNTTAKLLLIYFAVRSISVINFIDWNAYLIGYQRFMFGFLAFFLAIVIGRKKDVSMLAIWVIILTSFVNTIADLSIYFFTTLTLQFFQNIIHPSTYKVIEADAMRSRIFFNQYNEISVVFMVYFFIYLFNKNQIVKLAKGIFLSLFGALLLAVGMISGWRIRIADFFFALFSTLFLFIHTKQAKTMVAVISTTVILIILSVSLWSITTQSTNIIDRIGRDIGPRFKNVEKTNTRIMLWRRAIDVGLKYPLTGVGFDHFIYYLDDQRSKYYTLSLHQSKNYLTFLVLQSPHNIFFTHLAESGLVAFFVFVFMILFFFKKDAQFIWKNYRNKDLRFVWILQFWTLMVFGLFHPTDSTEYYFLFFFIRGMIESYG